MTENKVWKKGISIVIPAYNEEGSIANVVSQTHRVLMELRVPFEIIVVDDCSSDETSKNCPKEICSLLRHPKNYGYGRTLLTGINNSLYPYIGIIDADNTYDPEYFKKLIPAMDIYDMVIGARKILNQSFMVSILRMGLKSLVWFFSQHDSKDPNSGLRVFNKSLVVKGGHLFSRRFSFSTSLTFFAALNHQFIEYIPIEYHDRTGSSKVRHVRDSLRTLWLVLSMSLLYQPVKCFLALFISNLAGLSGLLAARNKLANTSFYGILFSWISSFAIVSMSFLAYINGKTYELNISDKNK